MRMRILPVTAMLRTLFTPSHERFIDHFQFNPQPWIGLELKRMLHSVAVAPAELMRLLPISTPLRTIFSTPMNPHDETLDEDMATSGDDVDEEKHSFPCLCSWSESLVEAAMAIQEQGCPITLPNLDDESLLINKGDHIDLRQLFFSQERNFLMKSNGQKVEMDGLSNKYVLLYIFPLVDCHKIPLMTMELVELRNLLLETGCFEIVSVGLGSDMDSSKQQKYFKEYSSQMTWPFIPYEDRDARDRVRSTFGFSQNFVADNGDNFPYCGIVDPNEKLLQPWSWEILNYYGHDAFPFTDEKIISLYNEEGSMLVEGVSLKALLGTSSRDYVLSLKGDKVPIQDLEDKVVCIILDDPAISSPIIDATIASLELNVQRDFVSVYVCRHFTNTICSPKYIEIKDKGKKECHSVPWLRIPYGDSAARKIWRVISRRCKRNGRLGTFCNVVGPHGSYVDFYALSSMIIYGSEAYPFTTRRVAELKAQELHVNFILENVLLPTCQINRDDGLEVILHPDCGIPRYGRQKCDDSLVLYNKRILVFFGTYSCYERGKFLRKLPLLYEEKNGTDEEFEVIYISFDCHRSSTRGMPWFVLPFKGKQVANKLRISGHPWPFCGNIPAILAFERDGLLVGMEGDLHLKMDRRAHFPYVNSVADEIIKLDQSLDDNIPKGCDFWSSF